MRKKKGGKRKRRKRRKMRHKLFDSLYNLDNLIELFDFILTSSLSSSALVLFLHVLLIFMHKLER